jgi:hypothetical protein
MSNTLTKVDRVRHGQCGDGNPRFVGRGTLKGIRTQPAGIRRLMVEECARKENDTQSGSWC